MSISPSLPYTLTNGTLADATQVMADFTQIQSDVNSNAAHNGANSDITSLTGLTTPLGVAYGGTGATTVLGVREAIGSPSQAATIVTTAQAVGLAQSSTYFINTQAVTYTIAQTTTLSTIWGVQIFAQTGIATITINASDTINGGSAGVGITIPAGYRATFSTDAVGHLYAEVVPATQGLGTVASSGTTDLSTVPQDNVIVSGSTTITSFGTSPAGTRKRLNFTGTPLITYNGSSLILPGAVNITAAVGDTAEFQSLGSGNWRCVAYQRANGLAVANATPSGFFRNLTIAPTNASTYSASADQLVMGNGSGGYVSVVLSVASATYGTVGLNSLDTGTYANNTWYSVFAVSNGVTTGVVMSLSSTSPAAGILATYPYYARIGALYITPVGFRASTQKGRVVQWTVGGFNMSTPINLATAGGVVTVWTAVSISSVVPLTASRIALQVGTGAVTSIVVQLAPNSSYSTTAAGTNTSAFVASQSGATNQYQAWNINFMPESTNVYWGTGGAGPWINATGYEDNI